MMWIDPKTKTIVRTFDEIRLKFSHVSFAEQIADADIAELGLLPVKTTPAPDAKLGEVVEESTPKLIKGTWTQQWLTRTLTGDELIRSVRSQLDQFAQTRGYAGIADAALYRDITDSEIRSLPADERSSIQRLRDESKFLTVLQARTVATLRRVGDVTACPPLEWPTH